MNELFTHVQLDQLVTAAGFIAFLLWEKTKLESQIKSLVSEKEKWIERSIDALDARATEHQKASESMAATAHAMNKVLEACGGNHAS